MPRPHKFNLKTEAIITPDLEYNTYLNTLSDNQRFTPNDKYDSYLYWKLNSRPSNFEEAVNKGMFTYDKSDNAYHANSVAWGNNGIGYFMKPKDHDTVKYELDWFNKGLVTEEGGWQRPKTFLEWKESKPFRDSYILTDDPNRPNFFRYEPKKTKAIEGNLFSGGGKKDFVDNNIDFTYDVDFDKLRVDPETGEVYQQNRPKGAVILPELEVKGKELTAIEKANRQLESTPREKGLENPVFDPFLMGATAGKLSGDLIGDALGLGIERFALPMYKVGKSFIGPIIENEGFAFKNPFEDTISWIGRGIGSHIDVSPTSDGWLGVDFIRSTRKGTGRKLYDAAIKEAQRQGLKGVKTGESLASAPKTYHTWEYYPDKTLISNIDSHSNGNMINGKFTTKVNTPEELIEATNQGIDAAIIRKAPVYGLTTPSVDVPLFSISKKKDARTILENSFKSELDWSPENWFGTRATGNYDADDVVALQFHIPEYLEIERTAKTNGTWLKMPDGSIWKGDPRSWVQMQSKAYKDAKLGQEALYHGNSDIWINSSGTDVTPNVMGEREIWTSTNPYLWGTYGNKKYMLSIPSYTTDKIIDAQGRYWRDVLAGVKTDDVVYPNLTNNSIVRINNVIDRGPNIFNRRELPKALPNESVMDYNQRIFTGDDVVLGKNVKRKSLLGNNGNFDMFNLNIYKGIIPITFGLGASQVLAQLYPKGSTFKNGGSKDDDLVDWIIREEGFNTKPENIGDGKITLGSGLTNSKWHNLYKKRGNKWSASDNRKAVTEEVANRRKWAESNIPNWDTLPESSQKALLSYKYNYNFNRSNSPLLFKALEEGNLQEAAKQINATSKDSKFRKGLQDRRKREQDWFLSDILQKLIQPENILTSTISEIPVSTSVYNPFIIKEQATQVFPTKVLKDDSFIETRSITPEEYKINKFQEIIDKEKNFNSLMNNTNIKNYRIPEYVPNTGNPILDSISTLNKKYDEGGYLNTSLDWDKLSMKEKAAYIRMGVANGYKDIDSIREVYNEFRKGGTKLTKRAPYIYEELPRLLLEAGVSVRVTSGYRKPGVAGKLGKFSHHTLHLAVDIVPSGTSTWDDIRDALYNNPKIRSYMLTNGYGLLDETDPKVMKQTGATGAHFHIGKDTNPARQYAARASSNIDNTINNPRYVEQQLAINNLPSQSIQPTSQLPLQNTNNIAMEGNLPEVVITPKRQYVLVDPYDMLDRMNTMMVLPILPIIEEQPKPLTANERLKLISNDNITLFQKLLEDTITRDQLLGIYDSDKLKRDIEDLLFYRNMNSNV